MKSFSTEYLGQHAGDYANAFINEAKSTVVSELSAAGQFVLSRIFVTIFFVAAGLFLSLGASIALGAYINFYALGFALTGGFLLLLGALVAVFRKQIFGNRLIKRQSIAVGLTLPDGEYPDSYSELRHIQQLSSFEKQLAAAKLEQVKIKAEAMLDPQLLASKAGLWAAEKAMESHE